MFHIETLKRKNSKHYSYLKDIGETIPEVLKYLQDNNLKANIINTPYFFTYIHLSDFSIITQSVNFNGTKMPCSPTKLLEALRSL